MAQLLPDFTCAYHGERYRPDFGVDPDTAEYEICLGNFSNHLADRLHRNETTLLLAPTEVVVSHIRQRFDSNDQISMSVKVRFNMLGISWTIIHPKGHFRGLVVKLNTASRAAMNSSYAAASAKKTAKMQVHQVPQVQHAPTIAPVSTATSGPPLTTPTYVQETPAPLETSGGSFHDENLASSSQPYGEHGENGVQLGDSVSIRNAAYEKLYPNYNVRFTEITDCQPDQNGSHKLIFSEHVTCNLVDNNVLTPARYPATSNFVLVRGEVPNGDGSYDVRPENVFIGYDASKQQFIPAQWDLV